MYNPYYFSPYLSVPSKTGLFSNLFKGIGTIKWSSILNGTQKALNIANNAIPVIKQVTPMVKNAKTMFKVMNEFKKDDNLNVDNTKSVNKDISNNIDKVETNYNDGPKFFI